MFSSLYDFSVHCFSVYLFDLYILPQYWHFLYSQSLTSSLYFTYPLTLGDHPILCFFNPTSQLLTLPCPQQTCCTHITYCSNVPLGCPRPLCFQIHFLSISNHSFFLSVYTQISISLLSELWIFPCHR